MLRIAPLFLSLLINLLSAAQSEELKTEYLELRDLNYRFVQKYKEYLRLREMGDLKGSIKAEREFRKQWKNYLIRLPSSAALDDPNGYYASPERFGFNPLLWKPINNIYKNQPFVTQQGNPKIFTDVLSQDPLPMTVDPPASRSSGHDFPSLPEFDENEFDSILTVYDTELPSLPAPKANLQGGPQGFSASPAGMSPGPRSLIKSSPPPANIQERLDHASERYGRGAKLLEMGTQRVDLLLDHYEQFLNEPNPNPHKILALRGHISRSLGRLHHLNGILKRVHNRIEIHGDQAKVEPAGLESRFEQQEDNRKKLYAITEGFETLQDETGNLFALLPLEEVQQIFEGAAEELGPPTLSFGAGTPPPPGTTNPTPQSIGIPATGTGNPPPQVKPPKPGQPPTGINPNVTTIPGGNRNNIPLPLGNWRPGMKLETVIKNNIDPETLKKLNELNGNGNSGSPFPDS